MLLSPTAPANVGPPALENGDRVPISHDPRAEVGGSLERVVEAVDRQRELLERDIRAGVQQRLLAIGIRLELAGELAGGDPGLHRALAEIGENLDEAIAASCARSLTGFIHRS